MCDKELLVSYLYDEIDPVERHAFESHLLSCGSCRDELGSLRGARAQIGVWAPPEPDLAFQMIRHGSAPAPRTLLASMSPAWGLAAAAVLLVALASAIANLEIRYGAEGLVVRTGWAGAPAPVAAPDAPSAVIPADVIARADSLEQAVAVITRQVQALEAAAALPKPGPPVRLAAAQVPTAEVLRQVRQIVSESEGRQQQELAMRIMQVFREVDGRQRQDAELLQRSLARVQGLTDTTILRQRAIENHVFRVGLQQQK